MAKDRDNQRSADGDSLMAKDRDNPMVMDGDNLMAMDGDKGAQMGTTQW